MYSYSERIRAVQRYITLGRRLDATIRQLGYPTKNSLIGWYHVCTQDQDSRAELKSSGPHVGYAIPPWWMAITSLIGPIPNLGTGPQR